MWLGNIGKVSKYSILAFLIIVLCITISVSTLAKTEVYPACACTHADRFSLSDNPKILSTTSPKPEIQTIDINTASRDIFIKMLKISLPKINTRNYLLLDPTMPEKETKNARWRLIINLDDKVLGELE